MGNLISLIDHPIFLNSSRNCLGNLACCGHLVPTAEIEAEQNCMLFRRMVTMSHIHRATACGKSGNITTAGIHGLATLQEEFSPCFLEDDGLNFGISH